MAHKQIPFPLTSLAPHASAAIAALFFACFAQASDCTIEHCHDGDTCTVICGQPPDRYAVRVRLWCIDAPEMGQRPWGQYARDWLRQRASSGKKVVLIERDRDRHGRTVGELIADGENLGLREVREGMAAMYRRYCPDLRYAAAEQAAMLERRGIWRTTGVQQTPWEWRHRHK